MYVNNLGSILKKIFFKENFSISFNIYFVFSLVLHKKKLFIDVMTKRQLENSIFSLDK